MYRLVVTPEQIQAGNLKLTQSQKHYLERVVRLQPGDRFIAMDGQGKAWLARINVDSVTILELLPTSATELPFGITLVVALLKGQGLDEIVRCATELGVKQIMPVITARTIPQPNPHKLQRWRKIAQEAAEQSEREIVPLVDDVQPLKKVITDIANTNQSKYFCVARYQAPHLLTCLLNTNSHVVICTGPEGGWTDQEREIAIAAGFQTVNLGPRILRAITAPITALSLVVAAAESRC